MQRPHAYAGRLTVQQRHVERFGQIKIEDYHYERWKGSFLLQMTLSHNNTILALVQIRPGLPQDALLGTNLIEALVITLDPTNQQLVYKVTQSLKATPLDAVIVAMDDTDLKTQRLWSIPWAQSWTSMRKHLFDNPQSLSAFLPTQFYHIPTNQAHRIELQAYDPEGNPVSQKTGFIGILAPNGPSIATTTDHIGGCTNKPMPQLIPSHIPAAYGCTISAYFSESGFAHD